MRGGSFSRYFVVGKKKTERSKARKDRPVDWVVPTHISSSRRSPDEHEDAKRVDETAVRKVFFLSGHEGWELTG